MAEQILMSYHQVGTIVRVNKSFLGEPVNVLAFVYENYDKPGVSGISLISQNGKDLGGFNLTEQLLHLDHVGDTGKHYIHKGLATLLLDWQSGLIPGLMAPFIEQNSVYRNSREAIIEEILSELRIAESKHPWDNYTVLKMVAILSEESGEVIRAVNQYDDEGGSIEEVRKELIQTGAMVFRMLKNLPEK